MASDGLTLLGFDTATTACSVALWAGGEVISHRRIEAGGRHAETLVPMLREVAAEGDTMLAAVDRFAVTIGPGSFTGIRIGLATARGLALALKRPLIGLSTLEVLAAGVPEPERDWPILAALDAGRGRLYAQLFDRSLQALSAPEALDTEALPSLVAAAGTSEPVVVVGTGQVAAVAALAPTIEVRPATGSPTPDAPRTGAPCRHPHRNGRRRRQRRAAALSARGGSTAAYAAGRRRTAACMSGPAK